MSKIRKSLSLLVLALSAAVAFAQDAVMKPFVLAAADGIANVTNNLIWFLIFSDVIVWLLH